MQVVGEADGVEDAVCVGAGGGIEEGEGARGWDGGLAWEREAFCGGSEDHFGIKIGNREILLRAGVVL